jgi:hypothetical protein
MLNSLTCPFTSISFLTNCRRHFYNFFIQINELPKPSFMQQTLEELSIGTFENVITVSFVPKVYWILNKRIISFLLFRKWIDLQLVYQSSTLTWFIRYIYYWNLQFLNNALGHSGPWPISAILFRPLGFIASKTLNYLAFQSFNFEHTWWRLFQKRVVHTKLDTLYLRFYYSWNKTLW